MSTRVASLEISFKKNGFFGTIRIFYLYILHKFFFKQQIQYKGDKINLRPRTSDFVVFREIFMDHEYDLALDRENKTIVDLGANIGISSLYFSRYYPGSIIYALEADKENYSALVTNVKEKENIIALHKAIWNDNIPVFIENNSSHWARKVSEVHKEGNDVPGVTLEKLMTDYNITRIHILKVDIEGSEIQLFQYLRKEKHLLKKVDNIIVETHDWNTPGCSKAVFDCLSEVKYNLFITGEKFLIKLINE